jgi:hypothetical protein
MAAAWLTKVCVCVQTLTYTLTSAISKLDKQCYKSAGIVVSRLYSVLLLAPLGRLCAGFELVLKAVRAVSSVYRCVAAVLTCA